VLAGLSAQEPTSACSTIFIWTSGRLRSRPRWRISSPQSPDFHGPDCYFPTIPKPVIAAVNGPAIGIGFVYTLYCDLRLASDSAYVMTAFARRGAVAEYGASWLLPQLVGMTNATELMFSSRKVSAEEALRMGLLNRVVPDVGSLPGSAANIPSQACWHRPKPPARNPKRQLWNAYSCSLAEAWQSRRPR
jgi:enoyl-CoA hydratase/carnithine racemase